jgi:protein-disulfide isomerase
MASRTRQKEEARARRIAEERARAEQAQRAQRLRMLGGVVLAAIIVVVVVVVISSSGSSTPAPTKPHSAAATANVNAVSSLLAGIPESGQTLGKPSAPVTITEYADLDCPVCDAFALPPSHNTSDGSPGTGYLDKLISQYVRPGKAKIVFRSLETATSTANGSMWVPQQAGAYAAGLQGKAWYYIELFYYEQQSETSSYVTQSFLQGIAQQIPGLNFSKWNSDRQSQALASQVAADGQIANNRNFSSTPTIVIQGPKGQANPIQSLPSSYGQLTSEIQQVS